MKKTFQTILSLGCTLFFVTLAILGLRPNILDRTRVPIYAMVAGGWCVLLGMSYLITEFVRRGLRRSKH